MKNFKIFVASALLLIFHSGCKKAISKEQYFYAAIIRGNKKLTEEYVKNGINVNCVDNMGMTPLCLATQYNHTDIVRLLLKNNAKVNVKNKYGISPIIYAVENNNINIVKMLLKNNVSLNVFNAYGQNPFTLSASKEYYNLLKILLSANKIDIHKPDKKGKTVFLYAQYNSRIELILKEAGINISDKNKNVMQENENNLIILISDNKIFFQNQEISRKDFKPKLKNIPKTKDIHISIQIYSPFDNFTEMLNFVIEKLKEQKINNFDIKPIDIQQKSVENN